MRPIFPGDLDAVVRVMLAAPVSRRPMLAMRLLSEARLADVYRRATGRAHPEYGTGSLLSAAANHPQASLPPDCGEDYCAALATFIEAYLDAPDEAQSTHNQTAS